MDARLAYSRYIPRIAEQKQLAAGLIPEAVTNGCENVQPQRS